MRNPTLHEQLEAFVTDAGLRLTQVLQSGDEIPFEVVKSDGRKGGRIPLYCYRPLTGEFISRRLGLLTALPTYAPAANALEGIGGGDAYLCALGERQVPERSRDLADAVLSLFLRRVFGERSEFEFDDGRFEVSYEELERALYQGRCVTEVIGPLLGIDLDPETAELALGDGLALARPSALTGVPAELINTARPPLLLVLRVAHDRRQPPSPAFARACFRRALTALRLYEKGTYALRSIGWSRVEDGPWSPIPLGAAGRPRELTLIPAAGESELRGFCSLINRRLPSGANGQALDNSGAGEVNWALARFEMGCERTQAFEALTDYLLALRVLLEPEGPASGRLAQRLSVICAPPEQRTVLAERIARAVELEHQIITGMAAVDAQAELLIEEVAEHLRAVLRDVLCGHLNADVRGVADDLLAEAAAEPAIAA